MATRDREAPADLSHLDLPLGRASAYPRVFDPGLLCGVERGPLRADLGADPGLRWGFGADLWTMYEVSWLDAAGQAGDRGGGAGDPRKFAAAVRVEVAEAFLKFAEQPPLLRGRRGRGDDRSRALAAVCGAAVEVRLVEGAGGPGIGALPGRCIDDAEVTAPRFTLDRRLLAGAADRSRVTAEAVWSGLFRSLCPVTGQPDWAHVWIDYAGPTIADAALLAYLLSFREHGDFHERCVERIFADVRALCEPSRLTVAARFTRRGGLDINPWRSTQAQAPRLPRLARQ
jgi:7-cyano-7-deazaguanine reductase